MLLHLPLWFLFCQMAIHLRKSLLFFVENNANTLYERCLRQEKPGSRISLGDCEHKDSPHRRAGPSSLQCAVRFWGDRRRGTGECDVGGVGRPAAGPGVCMAGV